MVLVCAVKEGWTALLLDRKRLGNAVFRNTYRSKILRNFLVACCVCNFVFRTFVGSTFSFCFKPNFGFDSFISVFIEHMFSPF